MPMRDDAVEREKIGRERDPEIIPIGDDVTAVAADAKLADPSSHEQHPEGMGQFMPENVNQHAAAADQRTRSTTRDAQRKEPEFFARPKPLRDGCAGEDGEERLAQDRADRQQKNRDDEFHPARRHHERRVMPGATSRASEQYSGATFDAPRWLPSARAAGFCGR